MEKKEATMDEIDESIRLKDIEKINPTKDQVVESMRLKKIGIDNPTLSQITVGLNLEKKNNIKEIKDLENKYNATDDYLKELLKTDHGLYKPSEYDIILEMKLEKLFDRKLNKNEFEIAKEYPDENRKEFIDAAVYLKELGIFESNKNNNLNLIKTMEELMKQNNDPKPTAYDLEEKLLFEIFGKKLDHDSPERKEIERQINLVKIPKFTFLSVNPVIIRKSINIGLILGPTSTHNDINTTLDMKGELSLDKIKEHIALKYFGISKLTQEQVNTWFYLRDILGKRMQDSESNNILNQYIPAIIQWKNRNLTPTLKDIDEHVEANKKFRVNLSIDQLEAWKFLQQFQENINKSKIANHDIIKYYIPTILYWKKAKMNPNWNEIVNHVNINLAFLKFLTISQYKAYMILHNLKEIKDLSKEIILKDYIPVAEKYMKDIKLFKNQMIVYNHIFDAYIKKFPENSDDWTTIKNIQKKLRREGLEEEYNSGKNPFSPLLKELNNFIGTKKSKTNPSDLYNKLINNPTWKNIKFIVDETTKK